MKASTYLTAFALAGAAATGPACAGTDFTTSIVEVDIGRVDTFKASANAVLSGSLFFNFSQSGFSEGAFVTGSFSGTDFNENGQLSSFDDEITGFSAFFSGNTKTAAFEMGFDGLFGLVYDLDGGDLGDGIDGDTEGLLWQFGGFNDFARGGAVTSASYAAGPGPLALCDGINPCGAVSTSLSGGVPEPQTWAMMLAGFGLVSGALRVTRRRVSFALAR